MHAIDSEAEFRRRFRTNFEHEVEFREIDMLRHTNNVRYVDWAETMRTIFFEDVMRFSFFDRHSVIIARHEMHYDAQVSYRDRVLVGGDVERWGTKSFDFVTYVWSLTDAKIVFHSTATLVAYDYEANASIPIPAVWRERADQARKSDRIER